MKERRNTRQRALILETVQKHRDHPSAEQIYAQVRAVSPRISRGTVYRNLKLLVAEGAVQMVSLPGESPRYESSGHAHHHHFQCEDCGRVFDVHQCPGDLKHLAPAGFLVRHHELTLYGQCADCHTPV